MTRDEIIGSAEYFTVNSPGNCVSKEAALRTFVVVTRVFKTLHCSSLVGGI